MDDKDKNKRRKRWIKKHRGFILSGFVLCLITATVLISFCIKKTCEYVKINNKSKTNSENPISRPDLDVELLTINEYSRPGTTLEEVKGIVVHYTANPKSTAIQNRNYFEGLKDSGAAKASSHFVIGLDGEIVQCIPSSEISYASNERNVDTLSIECCHSDETGKFNKHTYKSLVHLTAWLCCEFNISPDDIIRHYDVTGKSCPKYYVEHEKEWKRYIKDVKAYINSSAL